MTSTPVGSQPLASVIVLNFNGQEHLNDCLSSLSLQTYLPLEVLVVDNGSVDGSYEEVCRWPSVRWVPLGVNHGFAKGNSLGVRVATGEILVFVNNDMRFAPDFVERLVEPLVESNDVFSSDSLQRDWDDQSDLHQRTIVRRIPLLLSFGRHRTPLPGIDIGQEAAEETTVEFQACAGNMAVRRWMFEALGGFDGRMKAGWEDTDLCLKAWLSGWSTIFVPRAVCWHKVGATSRTPEGSRVRRRGGVEGRLIIATRHLPVEAAAIVWGSTIAACVRDTVTGRRDDAGVAWRVLLGSTSWFSTVVQERRRLYRAAATSPRRHIRWLERVSVGPRRVGDDGSA